ncbi:Uncharacterised protein [Mycobacterium tuberculosis]|nr:Uncharacterised protein [Mycobacterium tuberculosis]
MASKSAWVTDPGRQTQNPERGRKPVRHLCLIQVQCPVVRPKTPRGDGNPHGGTWTSATIGVVGPKTPRGDGNSYRPPHHSHATAPCPQTQNPERGRKPVRVRQVRVDQVRSSDPKPREGTETARRIAPGAGGAAVVRPKTTRGDGNLNRPSRGVSAVPESSDPKPREGTETTTTGSPPRLLTGIQDEHDGGVDGEDVWS